MRAKDTNDVGDNFAVGYGRLCQILWLGVNKNSER